MSEIVIDLDVPPPRGTGGAGGAGGGRRPALLRYLGRRPLLAAATAVLAAFALGAAAVPAPSRFAPAVRIKVGRFDNFAVFDDGPVVVAGSVLRGHRPDGTVRWTVQADPDQRLPEQDAAGVVLATHAASAGPTRALDRATGAVRWASDGGVIAAHGDRVVLGWESARPDVRGPVGLDRVAAVRASDGTEVWRASLEPADGERLMGIVRQDAETGWHIGGFALARADGVARLLDLATGRWRTVTGWPTPAPAGGSAEPRDGAFALSVGQSGALAVWREFGDRMQAYAPGADHPTWSAAAAEILGGLCDPWLCLSDESSTRMVDPATGAEVRRIRWPAVYGHRGNRVLAGAGRFDAERLGVVDLATGRTVRELDGWQVIRPVTGTWVPLLHRIGILTWEVAALRLADGRAYRLGQFARAADDPCQADARYLACVTSDGELLLWRYRPDGAA